ncbi:MAG: spermidine/putrescine ABC transporter substrate-binding protein [Verrucomicrobiales bacterium]|nr:spermidine/putrescine ABC transporter substrate-binding protein [Verrucomicrobiales bacterium]
MKTLLRLPLELFSVLLALSLLSACQDSGKENLSESSEPKPRELVLLTWSDDYVSPDVLTSFKRETGIDVQMHYFESIEEMKGKLASAPSRYDVVVVDDVTLTELVETKMFLPLDHGKLPNFKNLDSRYVDQRFDPDNRYSVPYVWGTSLIAYRNDKVEIQDRSWNLLWDEKLKGKVVMLESEADLYSVALLSMGYSGNSENEKELDSCTEKLIVQARDMEAVYSDLFTAMDLLVSGEAWASLMYSGDAALLSEEDPNISFFMPKEGAPLWMDNFAVSRDAKNVDEAHAFLNHLLRSDTAAENANFLWSGSPNAAAVEHLDPELVADSNINPPIEILQKCDFYASPSADRNAIMNQGIKRILDIARVSEPKVDPPKTELANIEGEEDTEE